MIPIRISLPHKLALATLIPHHPYISMLLSRLIASPGPPPLHPTFPPCSLHSRSQIYNCNVPYRTLGMLSSYLGFHMSTFPSSITSLILTSADGCPRCTLGCTMPSNIDWHDNNAVRLDFYDWMIFQAPTSSLSRRHRAIFDQFYTHRHPPPYTHIWCFIYLQLIFAW